MKIFTISTILSLCLYIHTAFGQNCPDSSIVFNSQLDLINYTELFPDCEVIHGNVILNTIGDDPIANLSPLNAIITIHGNLIITNNENIETLTGLENLDSIYGELKVTDNSGLDNLSGLNALQYVGKQIHIVRNDSLETLQGLEGLSHLHDKIRIIANPSLISLLGLDSITQSDDIISIRINPALESLQGLNRIVRVRGLHCDSNAVLTNVDALSNLIEVSDTLRLRVLPALTDLTGLSNLTTVGGNFNINGLPKLTSIQSLSSLVSVGRGLQIKNTKLLLLRGLENLRTVGWQLRISNNQNLRLIADETSGLIALEQVGDYMTVKDNPKLKTLGDLPLLDSIGSGLVIADNRTLDSLGAFSALNTLSGVLRISGNNRLQSIRSFDNLDVESITRLIVKDNPILSVCEVPFLCAYLKSDNPAVEIENNQQGCTSVTEVEAACLMVATEAPIHSSILSVYPVPARDVLYIEASVFNSPYAIYTMSGTLVGSGIYLNRPIHIHDLGAGMYYLRLGHQAVRFVVY